MKAHEVEVTLKSGRKMIVSKRYANTNVHLFDGYKPEAKEKPAPAPALKKAKPTGK